jgi:hypothetical protein
MSGARALCACGGSEFECLSLCCCRRGAQSARHKHRYFGDHLLHLGAFAACAGLVCVRARMCARVARTHARL